MNPSDSGRADPVMPFAEEQVGEGHLVEFGDLQRMGRADVGARTHDDLHAGGSRNPGQRLRVATDPGNCRVHDGPAASGHERGQLADRDGLVVENQVVGAAGPVPADPPKVGEADRGVGPLAIGRRSRLHEGRVSDQQVLMHQHRPKVGSFHRPQHGPHDPPRRSRGHGWHAGSNRPATTGTEIRRRPQRPPGRRAPCRAVPIG